MNIAAIRAFSTSLSGVDNTNEGGPAPFPDVEITTTSLPNATVGTPYSQQLAATGGDGGYAWTRISGTLPVGLSLSSGGLISGTPTTATTYNFTVQADDELGNANSTDTQALSVTVNAASGTADWEFDPSIYSTIAEITALSGFEDRTNGNGGLSLVSGITGQDFTKAVRNTFNTPSSTDQEVGLTVSMGSWADTNQPTEMWFEIDLLHSNSPQFTYSGPSAGGGPGGKLLFIFDQDQISAPLGVRFNMSVGLGDGTVTQMIANGNAGTGGTNNVSMNQFLLWDGDWLKLFVHASLANTDAIFESYLDGNYTSMGTGVDTIVGTEPKYLKYLALGGNINTGTQNDGMYRQWGLVRGYLTQPPNWPGA